MTIKVITGNIFTSKCQTIVNTVNCVGVMGAGLALECRLRYPDMFTRYIKLCESNKLNTGLLWIYKSQDRWILNFPTKRHWKHPSKIEYLKAGLTKFSDTYKERNIQSIAFPLLGADRGGLEPETSLKVMTRYLEHIDIDIEIYKYDPLAKDDLFEKTKERLLSYDIERISELTKIRTNYIEKVIVEIQKPNIFQLNQLATKKGIGINTLEKVFSFANSKEQSFPQKELF